MKPGVMAARKPSRKQIARDARLLRYAELRDQGVLRSDAARQVGVTYEGAGRGYERWYRSVRGLPPGQRASWFISGTPDEHLGP